MTSVVFSDKLQAIADEIAAGADLRTFVIARCVEIAKGQNDAQGVKCLELIARLALGDKPPTGDSYTNQSAGDLSQYSMEELAAIRGVAERMITWALEDQHGTNGTHPTTSE